jgi:hypothetical protein
VITAAIDNLPGEDKRYADMLSLFLYSITYDNGSVYYY